MLPAAILYEAGRVRTSNESTDSDLLRLSATGDEEAFLILYRRHQGPVFRFALHMSGSREIAEEVTQEVFLAMLTDARPYVEQRGSLQPYLIGIARNLVRRQSRCLRPSAHEELDAELRDNSRDPVLDTLSKEQELRVLRAAILSLPPSYREVVALCELEGMDYAQAAVQLGCAIGTVRSRLHRARSILEAKLRRQGMLRAREGCPI